MHKLTDGDYKLLKSVVSLKQSSLLKTLEVFLKKKYDEVIATKEYLIAKGTIPVALVAHMDTVFKTPPKNIYYDREMGVIWSPEGGCGDDRAGVFAILKIIQSGLQPTVIFTTDEEIGGLGAEKLVKDFPEAPTKLNYIIQLDRHGTNDCVFYDCNNPKFVDYVENFGFIENYGSFSDISEICPAWDMAGVNLSIGYEDEHSVSETLHVNPLLKTIAQVKKMLREEFIPEFKYISSVSASYWNRYIYKGSYGSWDFVDDDAIICDGCHSPFENYEMIPAIDLDGVTHKHFCPDCCVTHVNWCIKCGEAFETDGTSEKLCYKCRNDKGGKSKCSTKKSKKNLMK